MATARKPASATSGRRPPIRLKEAAAYCGLSVDWLKRRAFAGEIPYIKTNYALLFRTEHLDRYLDEHTVVVKPRKKRTAR